MGLHLTISTNYQTMIIGSPFTAYNPNDEFTPDIHDVTTALISADDFLCRTFSTKKITTNKQ